MRCMIYIYGKAIHLNFIQKKEYLVSIRFVKIRAAEDSVVRLCSMEAAGRSSL